MSDPGEPRHVARVFLVAVLAVSCGRTVILTPGSFPQSTIQDAGLRDAGFDGGVRDAGMDSGVRDAGFDAGLHDAGSDAGVRDAGLDAGARDAGFDGGVRDAGFDAGVRDAGFDAGFRDAGIDGGACAALPVTPCVYTCDFEVATGIHNCISPVIVVRSMTTPGEIELNLQNHRSVDVALTTCNPTGWVFHFADSQGSNGYGGDDNRSVFDAEIQLLGTTLTVFGNDGATPPSRVLASTANYVAAAGCTTQHLWVADGLICSLNPRTDVMTPDALRLNPPGERPGPPDARWFIGINGVVAGGRTGTGLTHLNFCVR